MMQHAILNDNTANPILKSLLVIFVLLFFSVESHAANKVLEVGQSFIFVPASGSVITNVKESNPSILTWTSPASLRSVTVTAISPGTATIAFFCYLSDKSGWGWVTYVVEVIDMSSLTIPQTLNVKIGETYKFNPIIQDSRMENYLLKWDCLDKSIASIDSDTSREVLINGLGASYYKTEYTRGGNLVAHKPGTTQIVCTYKGLSSVCQLTVEPVYVSDILFEQEECELTEFQSMNLAPSILPENATNKDLSWKSSNTSVAIVDNKGKVTALGKGKAVISATSKDGSQVIGSFLLKVVPEEKEVNEVVLSIDGLVRLTTNVEQGMPFTTNIQAPTEDWKIETFTVDGMDAMDQLVNGVYSVGSVDHPVKIEVSFAYSKEVAFYDIASGTESIVDSQGVVVSKEAGQLCISNIKVGSKIMIYTMGGGLIGTHVSQNDVLKIDLESNDYIISIDGKSFKIRL